MSILDRFLERTEFSDYEDFMTNFRVRIPENFNFAYDVVDVMASLAPNKNALLWADVEGNNRRFTFAEIKQQSDRAAAFFTQIGIRRGDMVMLILKRRYQFWFAITALHKIGAVAIPATHLLTPDDITYRCQAADIKAVVAVGDDDVIEHIQAAHPNCPTLQTLVSIGPKVPQGWHDFNAGLEQAPDFVRPAHVNDNDDIMLMYFTSGTTGEPKMVAHNWLYPLGHIITAKYWHNLDDESLHLTVADTGWAKSVWGCYYGQWLAGAEIFVFDFDRFVPSELLNALQQYQVTSFCAPPTIYRYFIREDLSHYDLSHLHYCTTAGEAVNPTVFERWHELTGLKIYEAFGQTETTATIGTYPWVEPRPGFMGKANPGYHIDLVDADGNSVPNGQHGEIVIRLHAMDEHPVGMFKGYYRDPKLTDACIRDGVYHTGDVAWRDDDGYYQFVGRVDDVIKSSGYRIGPFEVENALMKHPAVVECAVTGVPDEIRGMLVKATIVLGAEFSDCVEHHREYRSSQKDLPKFVTELQDFVKSTTAPYKHPRILEFVEELPKTISGKIRRVEIRNKQQ